jgi:hypothetical protein
MEKFFMKNNMKKISVLIMACSMGVVAQAQLIDSLTTGSLAPYTETIILAQNADGPFTFSSTGSGLQVSRVYSSGNTPQQDLFLRNDYSLAVGETLRVTVGSLGTSAANADFGIAIASQVNPIPSVYTGVNVSTRSNYLAMYVKPANSQVGSVGFNGTTLLYNSGGITPPGGSYSTIDGLWITETAPNVFSDGYTTPSGDVVLGSGITFTGASIDNSIGFYADLRGTLTSAANLTDLTISVPEPTTMTLCGLGGFLGLVGWMRRKNS